MSVVNIDSSDSEDSDSSLDFVQSDRPTIGSSDLLGENFISSYLKLFQKKRKTLLILSTYKYEAELNTVKSISKQIKNLRGKHPTDAVCVYGNGCHWIACYASLYSETHSAIITVADSNNMVVTTLSREAEKYMETTLKRIGYNTTERKFDKNAPQQRDGINCGIFALVYLRNKLFRTYHINFVNRRKAELNQLRKHMAREVKLNTIFLFNRKTHSTAAIFIDRTQKS